MDNKVMNEYGHKSKRKTLKTILKAKIVDFITGIKQLLQFCFDEITLVCLFLAMVLLTLTTKSHIDLIVRLVDKSLGFPMFGFVFFSVVNLCAALGFLKKRTLLTWAIICLFSTVVIFFTIDYMFSCMNDKEFAFNAIAIKSFVVVITGAVLTFLGIALGIIFSFIRGRKDPEKKLFGKKKYYGHE